MAYFLGRDVSVTIKSPSYVGVTTAGALDFGSGGVAFAASGGTSVTDVTGIDLGIGVTDEDITYMGSKTVLKAEIKKETTVSLTRKKKDNVWDVVFNGNCRHGAASNAAISSLVAPVTINESSVVGAGSVITKNVKKNRVYGITVSKIRFYFTEPQKGVAIFLIL